MRFLVVIVMTLLCPLVVGTQEKPMLLVLGLDGVGLQLIEELYDGGFLREFQRPIPMVASFPSISDPNWAKLVNAEQEKSYTKAHFEKTKNPDGSIGQEVGNIINHLVTPPQYEKSFDFRPKGVFQHLMSVTWTQTSALYWMDSLSKLLLKDDEHKSNIYKAFIMNTDIISHVGGKMAMVDYLQKVHTRLQKLQKNYKEKFNRPLEIVIVSDHGNYFNSPKAIDFEKPLKKLDWHKKITLKDKRDYAFVAPEIISFGAFYTLEGQEENLAKAFKDVDGVHVSLYAKGKNKVGVISKIGESEIEVHPKDKKIFYKIISGKDPFNHLPYFKNKKFMSFQDYFYATLSDTYPNALKRAWEALYDNVKDPASVLVSPELGRVFTNLTLEILTALSGVKSSHGSFHREETLGIVLSTLKTKDEAIEPHQFPDYIKSLGYSLSE